MQDGPVNDYSGFTRKLALPDGFEPPHELRFDDVTASAITRHDVAEDVRGINASLDVIRAQRGGAGRRDRSPRKRSSSTSTGTSASSATASPSPSSCARRISATSAVPTSIPWAYAARSPPTSPSTTSTSAGGSRPRLSRTATTRRLPGPPGVGHPGLSVPEPVRLQRPGGRGGLSSRGRAHPRHLFRRDLDHGTSGHDSVRHRCPRSARVIVDPSTAVASATTAAAVNAAENPVGASTEVSMPPAGVPIAVNAAVPRAAPIWVAEPASPEASPTWPSGVADGDDHGGGHEAEGDAGGDENQPGEDRDEVPRIAWCVGKPQVTGGEHHEADDESTLGAEDPDHPRQDDERDSEPGERRWGPWPAPPVGGPWRGPVGDRGPRARTWTLWRHRRGGRGRRP